MKHLLALALVCLSFGFGEWYRHSTTFGDDPLEIGSVEDRDAVARYEFQRTRNPITNKMPENITAREAAFVAQLNAKNNAFPFAVPGAADELLRMSSDSLLQHGVVRTGGRTRSLALDVDNESTLVAGTAGGGIWRSTNDGLHWVKTTNDREPHSSSCLIQDTRPGFHHVWYYGTGEQFSTGGYPQYQWDIGFGIYKSTDSAKSWQKLEATSTPRLGAPESPFHFTTSLAIDASRSDSNIVYAACNGCIMRTNDGGKVWINVLGNEGESQTIWTDVGVSKTGVVYAAISGSSFAGVWRSEDGLEWTNISSGSSFGQINGRVRLAVAPSNPKVVWIYRSSSFPNSPNIWKYAYISGAGDGAGGTWTNRSSWVGSLLQTQNGFCMSLDVSPSNENTLLVGGTSLYYTTDGFATSTKVSHVAGYSKQYLKDRSWDPLNAEPYLYNQSHPDLHVSVFHPSDPKKVTIGCDGGVFRTDDITFSPSVQWKSINNDLKALQFYSVAMDPTGDHDGVIVGGAQDNNSNVGSRDGRSMRWLLAGDGMINEMTTKHKCFLPSFQGGQVYRVEMDQSLDSAKKWVCLRPRSLSFSFIAPMRLDPQHDSILYLLGPSSVWRNSNIFGISYTNDTTTSSLNWRQIPLSTYAGSGLSAIGVCKTPKNRIYVGSGNGNLVRIDSIHKSSVVTKSIATPNLPSGGYVNNITVDPDDGTKVFVVYSNYEVLSVFYSSNSGTSWECVSSNLEEFPDGSGAGPACRWLEVLHYQSKTLYMLGTTSGVFWTDTIQGMKTVWRQYKAIPAVNVNMIRARASDGFVAIATHGLGIYTTYAGVGVNDGPITNIQETTATSVECRLAPNPANDNTTLLVSIKTPGLLEAELYDDRGARVLQVLREHVEAGTLERRFDLSSLASGHYTLLLRHNAKRYASISLMHYR